MAIRRRRRERTTSRPPRMGAADMGQPRPSDAQYIEESRQRMKDLAIRAWIIRLAVVAALLAVMRLWGIDFLNSTLFKGKTAAYHAQQAEERVHEGTDERTGAHFDTNP